MPRPSTPISALSADKATILGPEFFVRPTEEVARELIGKSLVRQSEAGFIESVITETEAYVGPEDGASHASFGPTKRTMPMFGPPGHWYVYLCYGIHWLLNITTREAGFPAAVLIRGTDTAKGPGVVTRTMNIDKNLNAKPALRQSGLWIEDRGVVIPDEDVVTGPRVGVDYAGEWAPKPLRFRIR